MTKKIFKGVILSCLISSCGVVDKQNNEKKIDDVNIMNYSSLDNHQIESHSSIIGKGFSSIDKTIKNSCLENTYHEFIPNGKSQVSFFNNLSSQDLNEKLNINTNGKIHGPQGEVSIDSSYLQMLDTNDSSSTVTLIANVTNGKNILKKTDSSIPGYKINDFYKSIFDKTKSEFIKVCGDEIIESQKLSAFLVITARMDFKNKASKDAFESTIGANKNIFEEIGGNNSTSFSNIDDKIKKSIKITISGTQLGGDFKQLQSILKKNVCNLNQIEQCNQIFETINNYFSNEFLTQLDSNNESVWVTSEIKSTPYSKILILNEKGEYYSDHFNFGLDYTKFSKNLSNIKETSSIIYSKLKSVLDHEKSKHFSQNELNYYNQNLSNAQNNVRVIDEYFSDCNSSHNLHNCISKYNTFSNDYFSPIDESLKNLSIGEHVATYNSGIETFGINSVLFMKKDIDNHIFKNDKKLRFLLLDKDNYELNDEIMELHCRKDYKSKIKDVNIGIWLSNFINQWPTVYTLIDKAINDEYQTLDVIWNRKESDLTASQIVEYCGVNNKLFSLSQFNSNIKKVVIWESDL
jgi:hypothetical protein